MLRNYAKNEGERFLVETYRLFIDPYQGNYA